MKRSMIVILLFFPVMFLPPLPAQNKALPEAIKGILEKTDTKSDEQPAGAEGIKLLKKYEKKDFIKYFTQMKYEKAANAAFKYLKRYKKDPIALFIGTVSCEMGNKMELLFVYPLIFDREALGAREYQILAFLQAFISKYPEKSQAAFLKALGYLYWEKADPSIPLHYLKKALGKDPANAYAAAHIAFLLGKKRPSEGDKESLQMEILLYDYALSQDPGCYQALYNKGQNLQLLGDRPDEARELCWKAVALSPLSLKAQKVLFALYQKTSREPEDFLRDLEARAGKNPQVFWSFGKLFKEEKVPALGLKMYAKALELARNKDMKCVIASEYLEMSIDSGDMTGASKIIASTKKLKSADVDFYTALYHYQLKEYDKGIKLLEKVRKSKTLLIANDKVYSNLGTLYFQAGKTGKAKQNLVRAVKLNDRDTIALFNLGYLYLKDGSKKAARECMEKIIKIKPGSREAENALKVLSNLEKL